MGLSSTVTRLRLKGLVQGRLEEAHWSVPVDGSGQPLGSVVDGDVDGDVVGNTRRLGQTILTRNFSLSGYLARSRPAPVDEREGPSGLISLRTSGNLCPLQSHFNLPYAPLIIRVAHHVAVPRTCVSRGILTS